MKSRYNIFAFGIIMAIIMPILGFIMLVQEGTSDIEKIFAINLILGGITQLFSMIYLTIKKSQLDITIVFWVNIICIFQVWILLPIYIFSSKAIQNIIRKVCKIFLILLFVFIILMMICDG